MLLTSNGGQFASLSVLDEDLLFLRALRSEHRFARGQLLDLRGSVQELQSGRKGPLGTAATAETLYLAEAWIAEDPPVSAGRWLVWPLHTFSFRAALFVSEV